MLIQVTHPKPNYELWIDPFDIVVMERYTKPRSIIIQTTDDIPSVTGLVLKNGKVMSCMETPTQIGELIAEAITKSRQAQL